MVGAQKKNKRIEWIRKGLENKPSLNDYLQLWELGVFSLCVLQFFLHVADGH